MQANRTSAKIKPKTKFTQKPAFDPQVFLDSAGLARKVAEFRKKETIFDLTGVFCTSESEREFTLEGSWYADEEIQAGADRDTAAAG